MGTYPDLPSLVLETGQDLQDVLDEHSGELIGEAVISKFGHTNLPYLPKVLSIDKALPLQLHPVCQVNGDIQRLPLLTPHRIRLLLPNCMRRTRISLQIPTTSQRLPLHLVISKHFAASNHWKTLTG